MNKHTPGPWKVTGEELVSVGDQELFHRVIRDEGERWTALVEIEDREGEANAHLIAAAPAMYEALVKAMVLIDIAALEEENRAYRGEQQPITSEARDRQHLAQAALAQAEGSKP